MKNILYSLINQAIRDLCSPHHHLIHLFKIFNAIWFTIFTSLSDKVAQIKTKKSHVSFTKLTLKSESDAIKSSNSLVADDAWIAGDVWLSELCDRAAKKTEIFYCKHWFISVTISWPRILCVFDQKFKMKCLPLEVMQNKSFFFKVFTTFSKAFHHSVLCIKKNSHWLGVPDILSVVVSRTVIVTCRPAFGFPSPSCGTL